MRLDRFRTLTSAVVVAALATGVLAACGSDDDEPQSLTFKVASNGAVTGPSSAETGTAEITLDNASKKDAGMQLIRAEGNLSAQEFIEAFQPVITDQAPIPDGIFAAGGTGTIKGGESQTVTQVLEPGTYYALNIDSGPRPDPKTLAAVKVTGEASDDELEADTTVDAVDYSFEAEGLTAGNNEILFNNTGAQPHHIVAAPLTGDATEADAKEFFTSDQPGGPPPIDQKSTVTTAVLEGGTSQLVDLNLKKKGDYVLLCFISDRQGGPEHTLKGMVKGVKVEG